MRKRVNFEDWRIRFESQVFSRGLGKILESLTSVGVNRSEFEQLVYAASGVGGRPMKEWKEEHRKRRRAARNLESDVEDLAHRISRVNDLILPSRHYGELFRVELSGEQFEVPMENFEFLPHLLRSYSQLIEQRAWLIRESNLRAVDEHGPEMMILAVCLRKAGTRNLNKLIADTLYEAFACIGKEAPLDKLSSPQEVVRKRLSRYRLAHPRVCERITVLISEYLTGRQNASVRRRRLLQYVRRGLNDPTLLLFRKMPKKR